jgi:peptide/nickel transport system permease protein
VLPWRFAARVRGTLDALASLPLLSFAPIATYLFAVKAAVVPLPGDPGAPVRGLLFASALLALPLGAHLGRSVLTLLEGVKTMPFLRVATAKGAAPIRVWVRHGLPTVVGPIVTIVATQLGALLGGAVVLERLFERPGLGLLVLEAYAARDIPVLEAAIVSTGAIFVLVQMAGALLYVALDARASS